MKKSFYKLKVDPEFEALIPPMKDPQYILLEKELKEFGCNKSIRTWDGYIIEGFQRYNLCMKHRIPFSMANEISLSVFPTPAYMILSAGMPALRQS